MDQMILLKEFYKQQKAENNTAFSLTYKTIGFSKEQFDSAIKSLKEHGYITVLADGQLKLTPKGCQLAKEL